MTSPGSASAGNLHADIIPDLTGFAERLRRGLERQTLPTIKVTAVPDVSQFNDTLRDKLSRLATVKTEALATPSVKGFNKDLRDLLRALPTLKTEVLATPSVLRFNEKLKDLLKGIATLKVKVNAVPDVSDFNADLQRDLSALPTLNTKVKVEPDFNDFATTLQGAVNGLQPTPTIKVRVDPDLTGFRGRLRAAVTAMGTPPTIRVRIEPDLTGFGGAVASSARLGAADGGAYGAAFRAVVVRAYNAIPPYRVTLERLPEVQRDLNTLQGDLRRLASQRIGIDISADDAVREAQRIRTELFRLRQISPVDVAVEANIRAASLALSRLESQLAAVGRDRTTTVRVRADSSQLNGLQTALLGSTSRLQLLITAGLALGPAIVPAAAAAASAIAAIGGAAISAGAGLGVGILALSGVVGAVKALNDARNDQAKTQATLARQDKQEASGADQVRSAIASLANTRAQAASQARQSANQIADAERGLASAQRDALRAQQDITRAREDAKDALEDLNSSIAGNALSIRQANLDLADAKIALDKILKDPTATKRQREEAQLTYDRAKQQIDDLTTRQGRYAEEKKRADKVGIEGSEQVVAAQEKAQDAQERVAEAERSLNEARIGAAEQQRQAAFSIAQAQQAVVAAQRAVATSAVSAAATGGAAMDTLAEKMGKLSPQGQKFAQFIVSLQPELVGLRQSAEQALPGFEAGIRALLPALPALNDFVRRVAVSLGEMGENLGTGLNSQKVRPFFSYIDATAIPTMRELGESASNVGVGFANLIVGFGPAQRQFTGGLVDMTQRFETWSSTLDRNNGFQRFLDYAITRGPVVLATVGDLSGAVIHLLEASAPAGDVVLTILSGIAAAIDAIPVPVLATLLGVMTALRIAALLTALPIGALGASLATMPGRLIAMTTSMGAARAGLASFAAAIGGPVTIAIAAATLGIGYLIAQGAKSRAEIDRLKSSMDSYGNALKNGLTPESRANAQAILAQDQALRGLVAATDRAGISQQTVAAGLNGDRNARQQVIAALNQQIEAEKAKQREARAGGDAENEASAQHKKRAESLEQLRIAFAKSSGANAEAIDLANKLAEEQRNLGANLSNVKAVLDQTGGSALGFGAALETVGALSAAAGAKADLYAVIASRVAESQLDATEKAQLFGVILGGLGNAATIQGDTFNALAGTFNRIAESSLNASDKVGLLRRALEQMYGAAIAQTEADEALIRAKLELTTQVNANSAGFDLNKAKGDENTRSILSNRDALQLALEKAREKYLQDIANGISQDVAREAHRKNIEQITLGIEPTQRNSQAVGDLVRIYGALPDKKTTQVSTPGLDEAIQKVIQAHAIQQGVANGWTRDRIEAEAKILRGIIFGGYAGNPAAYKADGGLIEGWSPHDRADNIPAWLTAREFVQPVSTVDYYGVGFMEALRQKRIPRDAIQGYATGGLVKVPQEWPIRMPVTVKMPKTIDQLWAEWEAAQYSGGGAEGIGGNASVGFPPWPRAHPGRGGPSGDSGVWRSIVALIRSTGPLSGAFGNGYRPGDPLWHGAGHALDWMGYNQDALATFLAARRPLELIHRTASRDYAYTRGVNKGSFSRGLMEAHRNHIHIAMSDGGLVPNIAVPNVSVNLGPSLAQTLGIPHLVRDQGGWIPPGLSVVDNRTGRDEWMFNDSQMQALTGTRGGSDQPLFHADTLVVNETHPADIAEELFWKLKTQ